MTIPKKKNMKKQTKTFQKNVLISIFAGVSFILFSASALTAKAGVLNTDPPPDPFQNPLSGPTTSSLRNPHINGDCLGCHGNPSMTGITKDGEEISLYIQPSEHQDSFHSREGGGCSKFCHEAQLTYPHLKSPADSCPICHWKVTNKPPQENKLIFSLDYNDARQIALDTNASCQKCHVEIYESTTDSAHTRIMEEGNRFAPVCSDCHSGHDISLVTRQSVSDVCKKCHLAEYSTYKGSVHGSVLEANGNPDVPTCITCHGSHVVSGPDIADFRAATVKICGDCHSDHSIMDKYNISTDVLSTYMDDVHGVVDFYRKTNFPEVTRAACFDCHGKHNILGPDDPSSNVYPENLQSTCQKCHKDTNIRFPQTWLSHKTIGSGENIGLSLVNKVLMLFVILIAVAILILIIIDARRRISLKIKARSVHEE